MIKRFIYIFLSIMVLSLPVSSFAEDKILMINAGGGVNQANVGITGGTIDGAVIGGTTPEEIQGKFVTVEKATDSAVLTASECSDTLITNQGWDGADDQTFTLPAAVAGRKAKFLAVVASGGTADTYFDPADGTTKIYLDGKAMTDGHRVWFQEIAIGESIVFHTATFDGGTSYDWVFDSCNGIADNKGS